MKTTPSLLLAVTFALGLPLVAATAGEPFLSPRAAALRHDFRKVSTVATSPNLASKPYLGAAGRLEWNRVRIAPSDPTTPNLVQSHYAGAGAKNPYADSTRFGNAPLLATARTCDMVCCQKN